MDIPWIDNIIEKGKAKQNYFCFPKFCFPRKAVFYIKLKVNP